MSLSSFGSFTHLADVPWISPQSNNKVNSKHFEEWVTGAGGTFGVKDIQPLSGAQGVVAVSYTVQYVFNSQSLPTQVRALLIDNSTSCRRLWERLWHQKPNKNNINKIVMK